MAEKYTLIPEQLFESQDAFIAHVKRFAVENGFNVRLDDVERDKGGVIRKRDIVCSSEGAPRGKDARREDSASRSDVDVDEPPASRAGTLVAHSGAHRRKSMKTGCRWLARASRQQSGMWKIIMLRLEHNHALTAHYDMLFAPSACTTVRSGDSGSITQAAQAAQSAVENGTYGAGPSLEFKNLFLQMSAACADLCWAAARRPETIPEVLGEIRRLNQHLDKPSKQHSAGALPPISEDDPAGALADAISDADGLVMMGHQQSVVETPAQVIAQSQQSRAEQSPELNAPQPAAQQDSAQSGTALPAPPAVSVASPPTGPVKRSRGRPRKNPLGTDGKPAKSRRKQSAKSQQQQQQQSQAQQQIAHLTPTPASLASLSQQIISQNAAAASSPVNVQRPPGSSLALPQPIQAQQQQQQPHHQQQQQQPVQAQPQQQQQQQQQHQQQPAHAQTVPAILDPRSHLPMQRQQPQQPQPQPQQSPTFFLGAAEGNGYTEQRTAAVGHPAAAAATAEGAYPDATEAVGYSAQKPRAGTAAAAAAVPAAVPQHPAASAGALRRSGHVFTTAADPALPAPISRSTATAISSISDPAADAPATIDDAPRSAAAAAAAAAAVAAQSPLPRPSPLPVAISASASQAAAAAAAVYHYPQQHYHDDHQFYRQHADAASAASQPATAMSHLVLPNASAVGYHGQLARMQPPQQPASAPVSDSASHHQQQQQRAPMFHLNPSSMHAAQMGRDPSAAQIGYFLVPPTQKQQQQQQQAQQQQAQQQQPLHPQQQQQYQYQYQKQQHQTSAAISPLPPLANHQGSVISSESAVAAATSRRFEELHINSYQNMGNWQM